MSDNTRSLTARLGLDTSNFKKGSNEAKAELTELNSAMYRNRREQKELEAQIKDLTKQQKLNKQSTDEEKEQYAELTKQIDKATLELAGLKTEEQDLRSQIKATNKELDSQSDSAQKTSEAYQNIGKTLKTAGTLTATALAGMFTYTAKIAAYADEINTIAKQTGLATDEIQKFMYASELIDVDLDTLTGSMAKLIKNMNTATKGTGDAYDAFLALGVSITDSTGTLRNNQDVFDECIAALAKIEDETQRDAYAMSIFGKSAQDLNPLILGGTEQLKAFGDELEREGLILSQTELDKLNEFNDKIDTFKAKFQATLAEGALEGVDAFEELLEMSDEIVDLIATLVTGFAKSSGFIVEHKEAVLALVVAYGSYKAAMSIGSLISSVVTVTKSLITATQGATAAQHSMNTACKANPYILLASAVIALDAVFIGMAKSAMQTESNLSGMVGTTEQLRNNISDVISETQAEINQLNSKAERYEELRKKVNKTAAEERELYNIAAELEASYPNQIELIGNTAGAYMELGNQAEIAGQKMLEAAEKEASANALTEAYTNRNSAKARMQAIYDEITASDRVSSTVFDEDGTLETRIDGTWKVRNIGDAQKWLLGKDGEKLAKLTAEYNELNAEISLNNRFIGELEEKYSDLAVSSESLSVSLADQYNNLSALGEITKLVASAEEELANTNELSEETLNSLVAKYPELQNEVNNYINNLGTAEDVINHLSIAYQNDVENNKAALQAKLNTDTEYYKELQKLNDSAINDLANEYGVDLSNYESYGEAKLAIQSAFLSKLAANWQKYYDAKSDQYIIDDHDITQYKRELMLSGMSSSEAEAEIAKYRNEQNETQAAVNAWNKFLSENPLDADLTDYSKWYTPQLVGSDSGSIDLGTQTGSNTTTSSSSTKKEISIYDKAKEAFKKLVEDRIAEIQRLTDAENAAVDERIAAIEKEIAAREKLKEDNDLQEQIDYVQSQLKYSQLEDFERLELERKLQELKDEQSEQAWLDLKNAEIEALEAQKTAQEQETAELVEQLKANQSYASTLFTDLNNGYQSVSSIINNNSQQANVNIITEALSMGQVEQAIVDALGLGMII